MKPRILIAVIIVLAILCGYLAITKSRSYELFVGFSKHDVRSALGEPGNIILPSQDMGDYGAQPPPPKKGRQEVWVYSSLMKLTFVYFDERGHVRMIFFTVT